MNKESRNARQIESAQEIAKGLPGVTVGYIGNVEQWGDDRAWFIFLPHPGRVGTSSDSIGGYLTEERGKLLHAIRILEAGHKLSQR